MFKHLCFTLCIHAEKCLSSGFLFSRDILRFFFPQECSFSPRPLGKWPFGTKECVGAYGQSLSWHAGEVSGGRSQTRSLLLHTCCPAGAALAGHSRAPQRRRGHPMHEGPLRTIYKTPDNFYPPRSPSAQLLDARFVSLAALKFRLGV